MVHSDIVLFTLIFFLGSFFVWKLVVFLIWKLETRLFYTSISGYLRKKESPPPLNKNQNLPKKEGEK